MAHKNISKLNTILYKIFCINNIFILLVFNCCKIYQFFFRPEEKSDFDFMDEMSSPRLPVRRVGESTPKGSAKKKTASFNGVLSTMLRHRRLEQQEINSSSKKSEPNSPGLKTQPT